MPKVFFACLTERTVQDHAVNTLLDIAMDAGGRGYTRIRWGYSRTDIARNEIIRTFLKESTDPDDYLVMLDNDHLMPSDVIGRLIKWGVEVVGALAFRRGPPYFPCFFVRQPDGNTHIVLDWGAPGLIPCALVGTGAVAIKRSVFTKLDAAGFPWPYFRYTYPPGQDILPSEDIYFGNTCEQAGVQHHVDTTFCIPHLSSALVDEATWKQYQAEHPEMMATGKGWDRAMLGEHVVETPAPPNKDGRKISLLVPTLGRPDKLKAMLESVKPLVEADGNMEVVVAPLAAGGHVPDYPWVVVAPRPESERLAVPGFNWCYKHATGDILVVGGDDVLYSDPNFFQIVREEVARLPQGEGMVDGRDGNVEALQALTRGFVNTVLGGTFMPGGYKSWWANVEQTTRAMHAGKHRVTNMAHVSSKNPILDGSEKDSTYLEGEQWHEEDKALFAKRLKAGFSDNGHV